MTHTHGTEASGAHTHAHDDFDWAARLTGDCGKLDTALAAGDLAAQRSTFLLVHTQAATRFYQVDIALQRLCETLREIGKPLSELLRKLQ